MSADFRIPVLAKKYESTVFCAAAEALATFLLTTQGEG